MRDHIQMSSEEQVEIDAAWKTETEQALEDAELARREQHTPGPWETPGRDDDDYVICATVKGKRRTLAHIHDHDLLGIDAEANAALIARAPELAAEVERLRALVIATATGIREVADLLAPTAPATAASLRHRADAAIEAAKEIANAQK